MRGFVVAVPISNVVQNRLVRAMPRGRDPSAWTAGGEAAMKPGLYCFPSPCAGDLGLLIVEIMLVLATYCRTLN
jgi:hypothetical protein